MPTRDSNTVHLPAEILVAGHAIVTANGMIADIQGNIPDALVVEADQKNFQNALDESVLVVLGRRGHEKHPSKGRNRLVATRSVETLTPDPASTNAWLWNPQGLGFPEALQRLDIRKGTIAITGGQVIFDECLPYYTSFVLAQVHGFALDQGIGCFSFGHPEQVLSDAGFQPGPVNWLAEGVSETVWRAAV